MNRRLYAEGRHQEFVNVREQLKRDGVSDRVAWKIASWQFTPLDGTPHEIPMDAATEKALAVIADSTGTLPGTAVKPPPPPKAKGAWIDYSKAAVTGANEWQNAWQNLATAVPFGKKCGPAESSQWVFDYAGTQPTEIQPEEIPSRGALRLLRAVQTSDANYMEFLRTIWSRTIPSKSQMEYEAKYADDGRKTFAMLSRFEQQILEQDAETATEAPADLAEPVREDGAGETGGGE